MYSKRILNYPESILKVLFAYEKKKEPKPDHWKPAHRRKIGSVPEPFPVQSAHSLTTGNKPNLFLCINIVEFSGFYCNFVVSFCYTA